MLAALDLYRRMVGLRIRSQMQYRVSFLLDVCVTAFLSGTGFLTIALVLQRFEGIAGWSLWEIAFLYGTVETAFGLMDMIFAGFDPPTFGNLVRLGALDQMLLRPVNVFIQVFSADFVMRRLGRIFQGALVLVLSIVHLPVAWDLPLLAYILLLIVNLVAFFGGLFVAGSALTFWTIESIEVINIFTYGGSEMMSYPMSVYPRWMRAFFTFVLPGIFLNYYPALYILSKPDPLGFPPFAPFIFPLVGFGVLAAGSAFWQFALRRYQSTGS